MPGHRGNGKKKIDARLREGENRCPCCHKLLFETTQDSVIKHCPNCGIVHFHFAGWPHNEHTTWSNEKIKSVDI